MIVKITNGKFILNEIKSGIDLYYENGKITAIQDYPLKYDKLIDAKGNFVSAGFIDIHLHGGDGYEFEDGSEEAVCHAANLHYSHGTTTMFPTLSASDTETVMNSLEAIKNVMLKGSAKPHIEGVHLEGPYLSPRQSGAQDASHIISPNKEEYGIILEKYGDMVKRWTYAPEINNAAEFQETLNKWGIVSSAGHTDAEYEEFIEAYKAGCKLITHLYSCTSTVVRKGGFRKPGVIESAFLLDDVNVEIIADGCHLPPELIQMIYKIKGPDHICLVSDCIRYGGMKDCNSVMGGTENVPYIIEDGVAKLMDRSAFAGSIATADTLLRTVVKKANIDLLPSVKMITEVPARIMGLKTKGNLRVGNDADIVVFDDDINILKVIS